MNIKVIIENGEDGYFVARVPALKGCWSQGKTREEALENIREAIDLYLEPAPEELNTEKEVVESAIYETASAFRKTVVKTLESIRFCRGSPKRKSCQDETRGRKTYCFSISQRD